MIVLKNVMVNVMLIISRNQGHKFFIITLMLRIITLLKNLYPIFNVIFFIRSHLSLSSTGWHFNIAGFANKFYDEQVTDVKFKIFKSFVYTWR